MPPPTEKQARLLWLALTGLALATLVALLVGLVWGLGQVLKILSPVLWPLAIAGVLAYLLDPVVDFLEKKGQPRARSIISVFALALLIVGVVCSVVIPQIVSEARQLLDRFPTYRVTAQEKLENWVSHPPDLLKGFLPGRQIASTGSVAVPPPSETTNAVLITVVPTNAAASSTAWPLLDDSTLKSATAWVSRVLPAAGGWVSRVGTVIGSIFGIIAGLALVPVYAFYLLLEKRGIESRWQDYLPVADSQFKDELVFVLGSINNYLIAFFRGQVLVAICDAVLYTTGFLIIGLPYAILIGAAAVLLTMIPFLGAITICSTALVISIVQYGDWLHPLLVLAVFAVVQTLEGLVISPRIMGDRVGLHPLAIIIAVMAGTTLLGGLLGGVLAIPLAAVLRVLLARYVWKKREA
ncbi:MAG: AI-2E family transporter [Verrucomicrobiota bacterium]